MKKNKRKVGKPVDIGWALKRSIVVDGERFTQFFARTSRGAELASKGVAGFPAGRRGHGKN